MTKTLSLRVAVAMLGGLLACACATPVNIVAVRPDPQPWLGADIHVLFHYLGWPDSVESDDGRVGLTYTALQDDGGLTTIKFWIVGRQVCEVSGDSAAAFVLWGRSNRRLQVPYLVDAQEWDRRLGLQLQ